MLTGLHFLIFQCIAWGRMYHDFSEYLPGDIALQLVFSGKEVCGMCEAIEQARSTMQDSVHSWLNPKPVLMVTLKRIMPHRFPDQIKSGRRLEMTFDPGVLILELDTPPPRV